MIKIHNINDIGKNIVNIMNFFAERSNNVFEKGKDRKQNI